MSEGAVRISFDERLAGGRIGHIAVDNQRRLNCLNSSIVVALTQAFEGMAADSTLRAVVLTGAGDRSFIGGADLNELQAFCADSARLYITRLHKACKAIRDCPVPVIGRINGFCLGAGLEIAASCDMRVGSDNAVFGMPEVHMGLPSVIEAALLPGLIGWGKTREILLTGETFPAADALAMGFIQKLVPASGLDAAVAHWLDVLCRTTPEASRNQKALMNRWERVSVEEGIWAGIDALAQAYATGEPQAAIKAFFESKAKSRR
ncbi:MAG: enoyl-CoA hydratase [Hyphomicrobiaceae bacterium]